MRILQLPQKTEKKELGPETEALFDELLEQLRSQEPGAPMDADPFKLCDIDRDGDCDQMDSDRLEAAIGMCAGDPDYNAAADLNGDGCVTVQDKKVYLHFQRSP